MPVSDDAIRQEVLQQIGNNKSVAPRDVAQALAAPGEDWRPLLPRLRAAAIKLESEGTLIFVRKRKKVSSNGLRGVYRFAAPGQFE